MATGASPELILRPRLLENQWFVWYRRLLDALLVLGFLGVVAAAIFYRHPRTLLPVAAWICLGAGARMGWIILLRQAVTLRAETLLIRIPLRKDLEVRVRSVTGVIRAPFRAPFYQRRYGDAYVLMVGDTPICLLFERRYPPESLASLLDRLPHPETHAPVGLREVVRTFKVRTPFSGRDLAVIAASYVIMLVGCSLIVAFITTVRR